MCGLFRDVHGNVRSLREGDHVMFKRVPKGTQIVFIDKDHQALIEVKDNGREDEPIFFEEPHSLELEATIWRLIAAASCHARGKRSVSSCGNPIIAFGRHRLAPR